MDALTPGDYASRMSRSSLALWVCTVALVGCPSGPQGQPQCPPRPAAAPAASSAPTAAADRTASEPGPAPEQQESLAPEERRWLSENCLGGAPKKIESFGKTRVIAREFYALEHSDELKIPLWVCEHVEKTEITTKRAKRSIEVKCPDCPKKKKVNLLNFYPDPKLPQGKRAELKDYKGSGFDRGHMAPAADFSYLWGAMESSFYLSNMAPQVGQGFNRDVWAHVEAKAREYVKRHDGAWIVTGGFFKPAAGAQTEIKTIGPNEVAVPTHFYKIVMVKRQGRVEAAGFVLENKAYGSSSDLQQFVHTIDQIEQWTGLDFMPGLPSDQQATIEAATTQLSSW